ncbi:MAG: class I SAM-dependent methyltransferase [Candidatus Diapherotrites archaeon]
MQKVIDFYSKYPYPSKQINSIKNLYKNAEWITSLIGFKPDSFPSNSKILEAGCGTGEFSCGFALSKNSEVIGIDISEKSLEIAEKNKKKFKLSTVSFQNANVLSLPFESNSFDFVFSLGCVHHTENPRKAFKEIARVLKPNGFIVLGVYNKYGRLITRIKKSIADFLFFIYFNFNKANENEKIELKINFINSLFYSGKLTEHKRIWIADKYLHPHEHFHSISELMNWFQEEKIEVINALPEFDFKGKSKFYWIKVQLNWLFKEKSFFIFAGKKH